MSFHITFLYRPLYGELDNTLNVIVYFLLESKGLLELTEFKQGNMLFNIHLKFFENW